MLSKLKRSFRMFELWHSLGAPIVGVKNQSTQLKVKSKLSHKAGAYPPNSVILPTYFDNVHNNGRDGDSDIFSSLHSP